MIIENEKDKQIILEILKKLNIKYKNHKYFNDGASSRVILLNDIYLIKQNNKEALKAEVGFLKLNQNSIFQKIIYIDSEYRYAVYEFICGETMKNIENVDDILEKILDVTANYIEYNRLGFGYLGEETDTWEEFLMNEINYSSKNINGYISNKKILEDSVNILKKYPFKKKLLHGDFGTHNFIKRDGKLVGIIDPMPVIGDSLYDLLFAIVSNTTLLRELSLEQIYKMVNEEEEKVKSMFTVVLYSRISRCLKYHPNDINIYIDYWNKLNKR